MRQHTGFMTSETVYNPHSQYGLKLYSFQVVCCLQGLAYMGWNAQLYVNIVLVSPQKVSSERTCGQALAVWYLIGDDV